MKQCKLFMAILLAALCLLACAAADEPTVYQSGHFKYILLEDGTAEITVYTGKAETLDVPEMLNGYRVTSIGEYAFMSSNPLTNITLPNGVTRIRNYAFRFCFNLKSVTLPEGLTSIGNDAFSGCAFLTSITLPDGLTDMGSGVFYSCRALASVTLPESLTSIGDKAFSFCSAQLVITVPQGSYAEQWCIDNGHNYTYSNAVE